MPNRTTSQLYTNIAPNQSYFIGRLAAEVRLQLNDLCDLRSNCNQWLKWLIKIKKKIVHNK